MRVECVDYLECVERYVWSHALFVLFRAYRHYFQLKIQKRAEASHFVKPSGVMANWSIAHWKSPVPHYSILVQVAKENSTACRGVAGAVAQRDHKIGQDM